MEIGSEFEWSSIGDFRDTLDWLPKGKDNTFTFSGRTAIDVVLKNINKKSYALVPSYCCDSMLVPFRDLGIKYDFYNVKRGEEGICIELDQKSLMESDILLLCNYFGYKVDFPKDIIIRFQNQGGIVIEDITHSLLSHSSYHHYSDFLVASLRKWGNLLDGGYCCSRTQNLLYKPRKTPPKEFIEKKTLAMKQKAAYLANDKGEKGTFLNLFRQCNQFLANNYRDYTITEVSYEMLHTWNINDIRKQRINNAKTLYNSFHSIKNIKPLFNYSLIECPLFVPIVVLKGNRDALKNKLIDNNIYCPVHWPKPEIKCGADLYDKEISLICDQRYSEKDMEKIIRILCEEI